jgi:hypothetical protein
MSTERAAPAWSAAAVIAIAATARAIADVTATARRAALAVVVAIGAVALGGCHESPPSVSAAPDGGALVLGGEAPPQLVDVSFETLYPIFLQHKVAKGPKAAMWAQRYYRRWVRWTGRIRSFTPNGITLKQLAVTSTFDVSLWVNNEDRASVRARYRIGDAVTYIGRLDSYDDVWRTLYLVNGVVLGPSSLDLGF